MFELPEFITLARQMNETLQGKIVREGSLGNSPHKFVWYNRSPEEFRALSAGKQVGEAWAEGRWLFVPLEPGYLLTFGECGGKVLYHAPGSKTPDKFHLLIAFEDGSALSAVTQMWGAMELFERGQERQRQYIKDMRTTPVEPGFTFEYFSTLIDELYSQGKRSVKSLLTQDQLIPGLGNAIAQDILFSACLHPRHPIQELSPGQRRDLYQAVLETVREAVRQGGRYDEVDLYNRPGGYVRLMDKYALERPCPQCSGKIEKIQYLGGACYFCPRCQM
jgi:formamidopyrimidine-DNA glycosylase